MLFSSLTASCCQVYYNPSYKKKRYENVFFFSSVADCRIQTVSAECFHGLSSLQRLSLAGNLLTVLAPHLRSEEKPTEKGISKNIFSSFPPSLHEILLSSNPWHCDCHLKVINLNTNTHKHKSKRISENTTIIFNSISNWGFPS